MFIIPILEESLKSLYLSLKIVENHEDVETFQIILHSDEIPRPLRELRSDNIGQLVKVQGIVIQISDSMIKGLNLKLACRFCNHNLWLKVEHGYASVNFPTKCENNNQQFQREQCPPSPYRILEEESKYIDYQILKI